MKLPRLTASFFMHSGGAYHVSTTHLRGQQQHPVHTHDFVEVFWISNGAGVHLINGELQPLTQGTLITIRPDDYHGFRIAPGANELVFINVAFLRSSLDFLRERYFAGSTTFFWATTTLPFTMRINLAQQRRLLARAQHLAGIPRDRLAIESFLLDLLHDLRMQPAVEAAAPPWLQHALEAIRDPKNFRGGTPALAHLAGRTPQHVNHALKQYCGLTATAAVNRARMEYAATELTMSTKKIIDVCFECGFQNLSHFYEVFHKYHHATPRQYQQRQLAMMP